MLIGNVIGIGVVSKIRKVFVKDSFNRPNLSTLGNTETGQEWKYDAVNGAFGIVDNTAYPSQSKTLNNASCDAGKSDCRVKVTIVKYSDYSGILLRRSSDMNLSYYMCFRKPVSNDSMIMYRWTGSSNTTVLTISGLVLTDGDKWEIECIGSRYKCYQNGVFVGEVDDSTYVNNTHFGLITSGNNASRFDNFIVEEL